MVTGLILFVYVSGHLSNLALGLWSLEVMDAALPIFMLPWLNPLGELLLYGSMMVHMSLGFASLYHRGTLRMSSFDTIQLVMALMLPPLMVMHVLGTRGLFMMVDFVPTYAWLMYLYWTVLPWSGLRQVLVVVVAWIHGCMGVYYWMRLQAWWPRWRGMLYPLAFVVPVAALLGFVEAGKEALALAGDPDWMAGIDAKAAVVDEATRDTLFRTQRIFISVYAIVLAGVLAARAWRLRTRAGDDVVQITYVDGPTVQLRSGLSLLEASRSQDVPHTSVCGGKGRCGTCRVRIVKGMEFLPAASALESQTLARVEAESDVRLACQSVPTGSPVTVERLVPLDAGIEAVGRPDYASGHHHDLAIMTIKLHGTSALSAGGAAQDALFVINRFLDAAASEIAAAGGRFDQLGAEGLRASFGLDEPLAAAARSALRAARSVHARVQALKVNLGELGAEISHSISVHVGQVVVGELGAGQDKQLRVFGPAVETADALQSMGGVLLVSAEAASASGADMSAFQQVELESASRSEGPTRVHLIEDPATMVLEAS